MKKTSGMLLSIFFLTVLLLGGVLLFLLPKKTYSEAERRPYAEAPQANAGSLLNGRYFTELNNWSADHFPGREVWRRVKAEWQRLALRDMENNGFVRYQDSIIKLEKEIHEDSLRYAGERFRAVSERYLKDSDCGIYVSVIPDKSCFLADAGFPVMDFNEMEAKTGELLPDASFISLTGSLTLADYYLTDSHWRQEQLAPAVKKLLRGMGAADDLSISDFRETVYSPFTGVYAKQAAFSYRPESLTYLTGAYLDHARVLDLETGKAIPLYDPEHCDPRDPYTLFLGGSKACLRIENPDAASDRELILFRDSFGSAIAPLLLSAYRSVTLIDIRYIAPDAIGRYVRFSNQDVLFLYSTTLLNNSQGLR